MRPPGIAPAASPLVPPEANIVSAIASACPTTITEFLAAAADWCAATGQPMRHGRMVTVGKRYLARPAVQRQITADEYIRISYPDPTGEGAIDPKAETAWRYVDDGRERRAA